MHKIHERRFTCRSSAPLSTTWAALSVITGGAAEASVLAADGGGQCRRLVTCRTYHISRSERRRSKREYERERERERERVHEREREYKSEREGESHLVTKHLYVRDIEHCGVARPQQLPPPTDRLQDLRTAAWHKPGLLSDAPLAPSWGAHYEVGAAGAKHCV